MTNLANIVLAKTRLIVAAAAFGLMFLLSTGTAMALVYSGCFSYVTICHGTDDGDYLNGAETGQFMYGYGGSDSIYGNDGNDTIYGNGDPYVRYNDHDLLSGGNGSDYLEGQIGVDQYYGGNGDDKIWAQDGAADGKIDCGPGYDRVKYDYGKDSPHYSCEVRDSRTSGSL